MAMETPLPSTAVLAESTTVASTTKRRRLIATAISLVVLAAVTVGVVTTMQSASTTATAATADDTALVQPVVSFKGKLNLKEFEDVLSMPDDLVSKDIYDVIDSNHNGKLTHDEVKSHLDGQGFDLSAIWDSVKEKSEEKKYLEAWADRCDTDGDGFVSKKEFEAYLSARTSLTEYDTDMLWHGIEVDKSTWLGTKMFIAKKDFAANAGDVVNFISGQGNMVLVVDEADRADSYNTATYNWNYVAPSPTKAPTNSAAADNLQSAGIARAESFFSSNGWICHSRGGDIGTDAATVDLCHNVDMDVDPDNAENLGDWLNNFAKTTQFGFYSTHCTVYSLGGPGLGAGGAITYFTDKGAIAGQSIAITFSVKATKCQCEIGLSILWSLDPTYANSYNSGGATCPGPSHWNSAADFAMYIANGCHLQTVINYACAFSLSAGIDLGRRRRLSADELNMMFSADEIKEMAVAHLEQQQKDIMRRRRLSSQAQATTDTAQTAQHIDLLEPDIALGLCNTHDHTDHVNTAGEWIGGAINDAGEWLAEGTQAFADWSATASQDALGHMDAGTRAVADTFSQAGGHVETGVGHVASGASQAGGAIAGAGGAIAGAVGLPAPAPAPAPSCVWPFCL